MTFKRQIMVKIKGVLYIFDIKTPDHFINSTSDIRPHNTSEVQTLRAGYLISQRVFWVTTRQRSLFRGFPLRHLRRLEQVLQLQPHALHLSRLPATQARRVGNVNHRQ